MRQTLFSKIFLLREMTRTLVELALFLKVALSSLVYCSMINEIKLSKWWKTPSAKAAFRRVAKEKRAKAKLLVARFAAAKAAKARAMQLD